jgi:TP901 family phage tail tape measure protein
LAFGVGDVIRGAGQTLLDFDQSLADLKSITGLKETEQDLINLKEQSIQLGKGVEGGAKNVIEAYKLIASAKPELLKNAEGLNAVTESAIKLSKASGMDLPTSATALTDALNQFNAPAEKAGEFINILGNGALFGSAEIPQITEAMLKFGAVANTSNVSIQESTALIETLASKGLKGAEAGTALRNVMLKLSAPDALPKEAKEMLSQLGIDMTKLSDKSVPFAERLKALSPILKDETAQVKLFGVENVVSAKNLLLNIDGIKELTKQMDKKGTIDKQAIERTKTLKQALIELKGGWDEVVLGFSSGTGASAILTESIGFLGRNLGTILNVITKLALGYGTLVAVQKIQILYTKLQGKTFSDLIGYVKDAVTGTKKLGDAQEGAGKGAKALGTALKSIGFAIAIELAIELAKTLYDIASGTAEARRQKDLLDGANSRASKNSEIILEREKEQLDEKLRLLDLENRAKTKNAKSDKERDAIEKQRLSAITNATAQSKKDIQTQIENKKQELKNYDELDKKIKIAGDNYVALKGKKDGMWDWGTTKQDNAKKVLDALLKERDAILKNKGILKTGGNELATGFANADKFSAVDEQLRKELELLTKGQKEYNNALDEAKMQELEKATQDYSVKVEDNTKKIKGNKTALVELDTEFKAINEIISEQIKLLNELDNIYKNRAIESKSDEVKAEYDKQIALAEETGVANVDLMESLLQEETNLRKIQAEDNLKFKIDQLQKEYEALVDEKKKELKLEKDTLLAQKNLTPKAKQEILDNYKEKEIELNAELLKAYDDTELKKKIATENTADEIINIEKAKNDKINEYNDGVYDALKKNADKSNDKAKADAEKLKEKEKSDADAKVETTKKMYEEMDKLAKMSADYFIKQSQKKIEQFDGEINALNQQKQFLEQMAVNGNITAEKSLAQNEKLTAEANKKKAQELKKQERIKLAETVFSSYLSNVQKKDGNPIVKTISDISVLTAFINSLPTFYTGTERTVAESLGKPQLSGKDGHIVRVDGSEKILNPQLSAMTGNMTTMEIAKLSEDFRRGEVMRKGEGVMQLNVGSWGTDMIVSELQDLKNVIKNKPENQVEVAEILNGVMHIVETKKSGNTKVRNISRFS